jgi:hypothetical protein
MGVSPYLAPTYFPPSFFYGAVAEALTTTTTTTGVSPYNAPSYFPPSYFYGNGTSPTSTTTGVSPYNAPSYFPPSYFYGSGATSSPTPTPTPPSTDIPGRDQGSYAALMSLIQGLGVFEDVIFGAAIQRSQAGADCYPLAVVTPKGWEEFDNYDPTSIVRRVTFGITIVVRSQDGEPQFDQLDRLSTAILRVVDFSGLGSLSLPPLTRIRAGRYDTSTHYPEQSVELDGEFSSLIDPSLASSSTSS